MHYHTQNHEDVEAVLCVDQSGFRLGRSTQDQVLALTTFIENGFQESVALWATTKAVKDPPLLGCKYS
jgi:hypothetical protein